MLSSQTTKSKNSILVILGLGFIYYWFSLRMIKHSHDEQLTKNFRLKEFHSHDGADMPVAVYRNIKKLAIELQKIRDVWGEPISINSGYRSPELNAKTEGAAPKSYHMKGMAADLKFKGATGKEAYIFMMQLIENKTIINGGVGRYNTFVHYDIGGFNRRWVG
jgi:uncharacterized protein YcbK (DUF882 family)